MTNISSVGKYARSYAKFTFGDWTNDFANILTAKKVKLDLPKNYQLNLFSPLPETGLLRQSKGKDIWKNVKSAYNSAQDISIQRAGIDTNHFSIRKYAKGMMSGWSKEISESASKGTSTFSKLAGGSKGFFKGLGKRMPLIGTAICLLIEIPNLFKAFTSKDGGVVTGTVETAKTGIKLGAYAGGAAAGAAIGTAIFPGVGTFIGAILGGMLTGYAADKVVGKSFTEIAEEKEAKSEGTSVANSNETPVQNSAQPQFQPDMYNPVTSNGLYNPMAFNPNQFSNNPFSQTDWREKDFMAMNAGLV